MQIPMTDIVNNYRQKLSDALHQNILKELHIKSLEETINIKNETIMDLRMKVDFYEIAASGENLNEEPEETEDRE